METIKRLEGLRLVGTRYRGGNLAVSADLSVVSADRAVFHRCAVAYRSGIRTLQRTLSTLVPDTSLYQGAPAGRWLADG
jgi:hypothetical protein